MPIAFKMDRRQRANFVAGIRWRTILVMAAFLPAAPAVADVGLLDDGQTKEAVIPAPIEVIASASLSAPTAHAATQGADPARLVPPARCNGAAEACPDIAHLDWQLTDLDTARAAENVSRLASGLLQGGDQYRFVDEKNDGNEAALTTVVKDEPRKWTDHVPPEYADYRGFWKQSGAITTELLLFGAYFSLQSGKKLFRETSSFKFNNEYWFGKNTSNVGVDKLTHAFDTYLIAEILHMRLHKVTHASEGDALTAMLWASTLMALNEISDGIEPDHGYSMEDIAMNLIGATFSLARNTVPGLKEKVAFKIEIIPNDSIYSYQGKEHFEQQRFMLSIKSSGFKLLKKTPLRFIDFQVGYYASDFLEEDRAAGVIPKRHLFVGLGLNVGEIFFGKSRSKVGKVAYTVLDYLQLPYTSLRYDTTGRVGN